MTRKDYAGGMRLNAANCRSWRSAQRLAASPRGHGKYADRPTDLTDGSLVRMAERENIRRVFTLDRRDFASYRPARGQGFTIIPDLT
jgi:hypothetical protein